MKKKKKRVKREDDVPEDFEERRARSNEKFKIRIDHVYVARVALPLALACFRSSIRTFIFAIARRDFPVNDEECHYVATEKFKTPTPLPLTLVSRAVLFAREFISPLSNARATNFRRPSFTGTPLFPLFLPFFNFIARISWLRVDNGACDARGNREARRRDDVRPRRRASGLTKTDAE